MTRNKVLLLCGLAVVLGVTAALWATTFKYLYTSEVTYLETNGYGGATADLAADQAWDVGGDIDLETAGYYGLWITIEYDSSGTTDNIILGYFASYDGTNFDDLPVWQVELDDNGGADTQQTLPFWPAPPHGRIGVKTSGTTDTFDYQITYHPVRGDGT